MNATTASRRRVLAALLLALAASCGESTPTSPPPPPPTTSPTISCPADVSVEVEHPPALVTYPAPAVAGGVAPVTTACTTAAGSAFPAGTTDVVCVATDSIAQKAQCGFRVIVSEIPRLQGTSFLAFGDSLTCCTLAPPQTTPKFIDPAHSYAAVLDGLLRERYKAQTITFTEEGQGGELAINSEDRLFGLLEELHPEALLLFQGTNDINNFIPIDAVVDSLRANIRRARQRGVKIVLLSTLLPQIAGLPNALNPEGVVPMNDEIRHLAATEGAVLVDNYAAIEPRKGVLIGDDGLHTTIEGSEVLAETFLSAIMAHFELPPGSAPRR